MNCGRRFPFSNARGHPLDVPGKSRGRCLRRSSGSGPGTGSRKGRGLSASGQILKLVQYQNDPAVPGHFCECLKQRFPIMRDHRVQRRFPGAISRAAPKRSAVPRPALFCCQAGPLILREHPQGRCFPRRRRREPEDPHIMTRSGLCTDDGVRREDICGKMVLPERQNIRGGNSGPGLAQTVFRKRVQEGGVLWQF